MTNENIIPVTQIGYCNECKKIVFDNQLFVYGEDGLYHYECINLKKSKENR